MKGQQAGLKSKLKKKHKNKTGGGDDDGGRGLVGEIGADGVVRTHTHTHTRTDIHTDAYILQLSMSL